jgi:hypothetical protein
MFLHRLRHDGIITIEVLLDALVLKSGFSAFDSACRQHSLQLILSHNNVDVFLPFLVRIFFVVCNLVVISGCPEQTRLDRA